MPGGYAGRILHVDLTRGRTWVEEPGERFYRTYLGGKGLATYYLLQEVPPGADPLGPDNLLVLAGSVVSGLPIPGYSRFTVAAKSPLTGWYGEAESGGFFAPELQFAGFEAVVVTGKSPRPVYLYIRDGEAQLRDAAHLWGRTTQETEHQLRSELGDERVRVASIGPAGENLVRYACVMHGRHNAAGRCGLGAVMGSKGLKAVAVRGTRKPKWPDREGIMSIARWFRDNYQPNPLTRLLHTLGTAGLLGGLNATGVLPTRNFSTGVFEGWEPLSGENFEKDFVSGKWGCYACPVRCKRVARLDGGEVPGPEYETIASFGSNLGNSDLAATIRANVLCNELGLDTISTGVTLGFATECFEKGLLSIRDTGGLELKFGDPRPPLALIPMIARREGFGDALAEGTRRLAARLGRGAADLAVEVKGMEAPMHDPRGKVGVGLGYALSAHGADHMVAAHDTMFVKLGTYAMDQVAALGLLDPVDVHDLGPGKVRHFATLEIWWDALKALSLCFFCIAPRSLLPVSMVVDSVRAATGWNTSLYELMQAGERANTLARLFNIREGMPADQDCLPPRFSLPSAVGEGGHPGIGAGTLRSAIDAYYAMRGWDESGCPTEATLHRLGLGWAVPILAPVA